MTRHATRRRNKLRRSPVSPSSVPITSSMFESCSRMPTLAAKESGLYHQNAAQLEAPLRVDRGVLAPPAKRVPATQPLRCAACW